MLKRVALSFFCLFFTMAATAQEAPTLYTYAAHWEVPRASWGTFTTDNGANAALDRLVADGTLVWWSNIERFVHSVEGTTHGTMWAATSLAGIEQTLDELAKLPPGPDIAGMKHHDHLWRSLVHGGRSADQSGGYLWMTIDVVEPGRGGDWLEVQKKYYEPVYKKLVADGTILTYNISRAYVHANNPRSRYTFIVTADADADAKLDAALTAVRQENAPAIISARQTAVRPEHRDVLFHLSKFKHR